MYKKTFFLCMVVTFSNSVVCSEPLKNKLFKAMVHGGKIGGGLGVAISSPTLLCHNGSAREALALPILSGCVGAFGGSVFSAIAALFPAKNIAQIYSRAGIAGAVSGTTAGLLAWFICYFEKVRIF